MTFTVNNTQGYGQSSGATCVGTISISSGHAVVVSFYYDDGGTNSYPSGFTDSASNTYTLGARIVTGFGDPSVGIYYSLNVSAITSITLHAAAGISTAHMGFQVWDVSATGTISYSDSDAFNYDFTGPINPTTKTLSIGTASSGLIVGAGDDPGGSGITANTGAGYTADSSFVFASPEAAQHKAVSASTAETFVSGGTGNRAIGTGLMLTEASGGGGVTLALTGQAGTFTPGSLGPSTTKALLGQGATGTAGSLVPSLSKALLGSSGAFTAGTLTPSTTVGLTGSLGTFTAGILTASGGTGGDVTVALTGQRSAFAQGAFGVSISVPLTGAVSTGTAGTLLPGTSVSLSGSSATSSTGLLTTSLAVSLTGTVLGGTPGTLAPGMSFTLAGNLGSFTQGSMTPSTSVPLVGIFNSTNAGQMTSSGGNLQITQTGSLLLIRRGSRKKR